MSKNIFRASGIFVILAMLLLTGCDQPTQIVQQDSNAPVDNNSATGIGEPIEGQFIISLKPGAETGTQAERAEQADRKIDAVIQDSRIQAVDIISRYKYSLRGFSARLTDEQLGMLRKDDRVRYIEQDRVITLAPPCGTPRNPCDGGGGSGQTTPWGVTRVGGPVASNGTAWVLDTGVDLDHPDLNVDTQRSAEFVSSGPGAKTVDDGHGHGTHVSGTIAALDNDIGVVGVAAGATIVAVKVLNDRGSGSYSDIIAGIDYVASNAEAGDVANMSLGGGASQALDDAVINAADQGIFFALAAGNDSDDANNYSPARVESNNVWTISAIDDADVFASFSNWSGPTAPPVEFAGPGVGVLSLYAGGGTATLSGTSMASPHAAAILLLTGGNPSSDGTASSDPDGDPDPIIHN